MKIKKLQWINKPEKTRILNSHELSAHASGDHVLVYTFSEDEVFKVSFITKIDYGVCLILSPTAGLNLSWKEGVLTTEVDILGVKTKDFHEVEQSSSYSIEKRGDTILFSYGDTLVKEFTFDNIAASVSIGFRFTGNGDIKIHF